MSDSTARGALGWTHEPPTEEGWYWSRFQPCNAEDLNRWSPPMPRKIGGFINRVQRRETFREDNVQWWPARIQLPEEEIRESQLKEVAEKWAVAAESSRTSTMKELSGEGARELAEKVFEIFYNASPSAKSPLHPATALIEAWGEEKTRALREALNESIDFSSLTLTEENDISGFGNWDDAEDWPKLAAYLKWRFGNAALPSPIRKAQGDDVTND